MKSIINLAFLFLWVGITIYWVWTEKQPSFLWILMGLTQIDMILLRFRLDNLEGENNEHQG